MKRKHLLLLALPWSLVIAEVDYRIKRRRRRQRKARQRAREAAVAASTGALIE